MFRVPTDADTPSFDDTFKVGFFRWLTSRKNERMEWMRRRNAAAKLAERNKLVQLEIRREALTAERRAKKRV